MQYGLGLRPDLAAQHAASIAAMPQLTCAVQSTIPDEVDPRSAIPCLNQSHRNTCCGHGRSLVSGFCGWIETGLYIPVSRRYSYLTTKIIDGTLNGGDQGASIQGAALASTKYGECREATFPYWSDDERYSTGIPGEATREGQAHKIASFTQLRSHDQERQMIGAGQGGVIYGIAWTEGLANFRGQVLTKRDLSGDYLGEHAVCRIGYLRNGNGLMYNSHGPGWAQNGVAEVDAALMDYWYRNSSHGHFLLSDLEVFEQRPFKGFTGSLMA